jgi:hypothetical protein
MTAPWENGHVTNLFCSVDGKVLYFTNSAYTRLSIYGEDGLSEYEMTVPDLYDQNASLMSDDGNTFALPSVPSLVSGKDVLRNKRVVQAGGGLVYWTRDILFVEVGRTNRFRMLRSSDLSELGVLALNPKRGIQAIFECGKTYFANWNDETHNSLEWINDRRLQSSGVKTKIDHVAGVDQVDGSCFVALEHEVAGARTLKSAVILQDRIRERVDFPEARSLASGFSVSRDGRLLIGVHFLVKRPGEVIDGSTPSRVVLLRIDR